MATEEELVLAATQAIAADPNIDPTAKEVMGDLAGGPWFDTGEAGGSFHSLRALLRGLAPHFTGGGTPPIPNHLQAQMLAFPFEFAVDAVFKDVPWNIDHEAQGFASAGDKVTIPADDLYDVAFALDLGVPSTPDVICEARATINGAPLSQSTVQVGVSDGLSQITHPGFLASLSTNDVLRVQLRCTTVIASWQALNAHLKIRKV